MNSNEISNSAIDKEYQEDYIGDIYKIVPLDQQAWHAGDSKWLWKHWLNKYSLGIEICGIDKFKDAQKIAVEELLIKLMKDYNIPAKNVLRHADIAPWRKTDVHPNFYKQHWDWGDYQDYLINKMQPMKISSNNAKAARDLWIWSGSNPHDKASKQEVASMLVKLAERMLDWTINKTTLETALAKYKD